MDNQSNQIENKLTKREELISKINQCIYESGLQYEDVMSVIGRVRVIYMNKGIDHLNGLNIQTVVNKDEVD